VHCIALTILIPDTTVSTAAFQMYQHGCCVNFGDECNSLTFHVRILKFRVMKSIEEALLLLLTVTLVEDEKITILV
jgi:hypothetical protein